MSEPFFKFFWRDWCADPLLNRCRLSSREVWKRMLILMRSAEPFGFFVGPKGAPIDMAWFAREINATLREVRDGITDLDENGVFSRDGAGRIYSRRLLNELARSQSSQENGRKGGETLWGTADGLTYYERLAVARNNGKHSEEQWLALKEMCGQRCVFCGEEEGEQRLCRDHILPLRLGGSDGIENIQPACLPCATKHGPRHDDRRPADAIAWACAQAAEPDKPLDKQLDKPPDKRLDKPLAKRLDKRNGAILDKRLDKPQDKPHGARPEPRDTDSLHSLRSLRESALDFAGQDKRLDKPWPMENGRLRELALIFLAAFGNCFDPLKAEKHLPAYMQVLAQIRARGATIEAAWKACADARDANGDKPLFAAKIRMAMSFLPSHSAPHGQSAAPISEHSRTYFDDLERRTGGLQ